VEIDSEHITSTQTALTQFLSPETLNPKNWFTIQNIPKEVLSSVSQDKYKLVQENQNGTVTIKIEATRQAQFEGDLNYFILNLKRFRYVPQFGMVPLNKHIKIDHTLRVPVSVDTETVEIQMAPRVIICHIPGHYVAYVREGATWFLINDAKITPLGEDLTVAPGYFKTDPNAKISMERYGYVIFYEKKD